MKTPRCTQCMTEWDLPNHEPMEAPVSGIKTLSEMFKDIPYGPIPCMAVPGPGPGLILSSSIMPRKDADVVNNPSHYKFFPDMEAIHIIRGALTPTEFRGYLKGCALKYRLRLGDKGGPEKVEEDLAKSNKYREFLRVTDQDEEEHY